MDISSLRVVDGVIRYEKPTAPGCGQCTARASASNRGLRALFRRLGRLLGGLHLHPPPFVLAVGPDEVVQETRMSRSGGCRWATSVLDSPFVERCGGLFNERSDLRRTETALQVCELTPGKLNYRDLVAFRSERYQLTRSRKIEA